jgi:hypothetical protein
LDDWFTIVDEEKQKVWQPAVSSAPATFSSPDFALGSDPSSSNILSGSGGQSSSAQLFSQSSPVGAGGVTSGIGVGVGGQVPTPQALSEAKKVLDLPTSKSTYTERLAARKVKARARIAIARAEHTLPDEKLKRLEQKKELKAKGRDPDGKITKTVLVMFVLFLLLEWFRRDM